MRFSPVFNTDHTHYFTERTLSATVQKATGREPVIADVLDTLARWQAAIPADVRRKYTDERDSVIAVVTRI